MATIIPRHLKDGTRRYLVQVRRRGAPVIAQTFGRLTDAKAWARKTESDIEAGKMPMASKSRSTTLGEAIDDYLKETDWPQYRRAALLKWRAEIGHLMLSAVTREAIATARDSMGEGVTPATKNRWVAYLSAFLTHLQRERRLIPENVCKGLRLKEPRGRVRWLSDDELTRLRKALKAKPKVALLVEAALHTGARAGELLALKWQDMDLERGTARIVDSKNGESRLIPIRGALLEALKAKDRKGDDRVFRLNYAKPFKAACAEAGIEDFVFHDLRHHAASVLVQSGVDLFRVQKLLGHKSPAMTARYSHLRPEDTINTGDLLAEALK